MLRSAQRTPGTRGVQGFQARGKVPADPGQALCRGARPAGGEGPAPTSAAQGGGLGPAQAGGAGVAAGRVPPRPSLTDGEAAGLFLGDSAVLQQQGSDGLRAEGAQGKAAGASAGSPAPARTRAPPTPRRPTSASSVRK